MTPLRILFHLKSNCIVSIKLSMCIGCYIRNYMYVKCFLRCIADGMTHIFVLEMFVFILFYFIFILFYSFIFYYISFHFILFYFILFYFILYHVIQKTKIPSNLSKKRLALISIFLSLLIKKITKWRMLDPICNNLLKCSLT